MSGEFNEAERPRILERLDKLNRRLKKFPADGTDLHLTVKDRDSTGQKITLEAWLPNFGHIAATSTESDLRAALMDVREDLWRQIDDAVNRRKGV
jgi:ribosome-associated translation inhibitor RaiA